MAEASSEGFCDRRCEIDDYLEAIAEMDVMEQVADLDPDPDHNHEMRTKALRMTLGFQAGIIEEAKRSACSRPCEGYSEEGVRMGHLLTGMTIHCPVVLRQFLGAIE
jgi:hypothetical protein